MSFQFAGRIEPLRLRFNAQPEQVLRSFLPCKPDLLLAHVSKFTNFGHLAFPRHLALTTNLSTLTLPAVSKIALAPAFCEPTERNTFVPLPPTIHPPRTI